MIATFGPPRAIIRRLLCDGRRDYVAALVEWDVNDKAVMRKRANIGFAACVGLLLAGAGPATALDCGSRWLGEAEAAICHDPQLSRTEDLVARRIGSLSRRLSFGQFLGLKYWHALWGEERSRCGLDRPCLSATYRTQARFLDRLQQCLDASQQRRTCFRATLNVEREAHRH